MIRKRKTSKKLRIEGNKRKELLQKKIDNQSEPGLTTLEKERNIQADMASFSSNIDVSFHMLTEQYDTGSLKSLLVNTLATKKNWILELEEEETRDTLVKEEIEDSSDDEEGKNSPQEEEKSMYTS